MLVAPCSLLVQAELLTLGDDMHVGFASSTYCSVYTAPNTFTLRRTFIGDRCVIVMAIVYVYLNIGSASHSTLLSSVLVPGNIY